MGEPNGGICRVDGLAARPRRAERVFPNVLFIDLEFDFFRFRENRDSDRRRVNPAARLGRRDALDTMNAAFKLQAAVHALAFNQRDHFLKTPNTSGI